MRKSYPIKLTCGLIAYFIKDGIIIISSYGPIGLTLVVLKKYIDVAIPIPVTCLFWDLK